MDTMKKRRIAALLLLSVFLPMLVLSSLHVHEGISAEGNCVECMNHIPHAGHISLNLNHSHDCVLCQFVTQPFLTAASLVVAVAVVVCLDSFREPSARCLSTVCRIHSPRAPPVV